MPRDIIKSSQYYINSVLAALVENDEKRLKSFSMDLIKRNADLGEKPDGFFYLGHVFYNVDPKLYSKASKGVLHPSLWEEGDMLIRQLDKTAQDGEIIRKYMQVCMNCLTEHNENWGSPDVRDMLYEGVVDLVPELARHPRTRPEGFCLTDKWRPWWEKYRPTIEEYVAMRFFIT